MKTLPFRNISIYAALAATLLMSSCASTTWSGHSSVKVVPAPILSAPNWYLAKKNPPTYYPKGFSADELATNETGHWVILRKYKTRWFIPYDGVTNFTQQELYVEAIQIKGSLLTGKSSTGDNVMGVLDAAGEAAGTIAYISVIAFSEMAAAME